jgi:hypothetical protein
LNKERHLLSLAVAMLLLLLLIKMMICRSVQRKRRTTMTMK